MQRIGTLEASSAVKLRVVKLLDAAGTVLTLGIGAGLLHWVFGTAWWISVPLGLVVAYPLRDMNPLSWIAGRIIARDPRLMAALTEEPVDRPRGPRGTS